MLKSVMSASKLRPVKIKLWNHKTKNIREEKRGVSSLATLLRMKAYSRAIYLFGRKLGVKRWQDYFIKIQNENHLLESKPFTKCSQESLLFCTKKKQNGKYLGRSVRKVIVVICISTTTKHFKTTLQWI